MRVPQQLGHVGVGVEDLPGRRVHDQDPVLGCFEEPAKAKLGATERDLLVQEFGDVLDSHENAGRLAAGVTQGVGTDQQGAPAVRGADH